MVTIEDLRMMRALLGTKSLAAAARLLDLTPPALTMRLKRLEKTLGKPLVKRGSRGVELTDDGRVLADESAELVARLESLPELMGTHGLAMEGPLRIAAPFGFGRAHMTGVLARFHASYPGLRLTLHLSESPMREAASSDLVVHIGELRDSSWVKYTLAENRRILCASPTFLARLGKPLELPSDLLNLPCLCIKENEEDVVRWKFRRGDKEHRAKTPAESIRVAGQLVSNDGGVATQWALAGLGVMVRSEWEVAPLLSAGKLTRLLPEWELEDAPVLALTPVRAKTSFRLERFIEVCRQHLQPPPWRVG